MAETSYTIEPIGVIRSELTNLANAPLQGDEGNYEAWLELTPQAAPGLLGLRIGDDLLVLTWLHLAERDTLQVHPRGNPDNPLMGVFNTRSQDRPNPIGLHRVSVLQIDGQRLKVAPIEAVDGTPIVDIKSVLTEISER
ncbi:MAG: tRNA (N6-threonylcarbamoyladenosine(37)-N6)-methyltransferase TrmO [Chloroflexi bacterium]|nr:tRNA (N6-threonylcarbamoyladenosine(37)-N6)-methyltransferase TrmO [Chloroflexota bacterium]